VHVQFKGTPDLAGLTRPVLNIQKLLIKVQMLTQQVIIYKTIFLNSQQLTTHHLIHGLTSNLSKELDTLDIFPELQARRHQLPRFH